MKKSTAIGIAAITVILMFATFLIDQFFFENRRSRLKADYSKGSNTSAHTSVKQQTGFVSLDVTRMMVREGTLQLEVKNLAEARNAISKLATDADGYVISEDQEEYAPGHPRAHQTLRIPSKILDDFIRHVETLALRVESRKMSALDVTEEFIDIESRVATKKKMEARYHEIIYRATTISEIMDIERQIGNVRTDIESWEARLNYLKDQSSFSTLNLVMFEPNREIVAISFSDDLAKSLKTGWRGLREVIKVLAIVWPLLVTFTVVIWLILRRKRKQLLQPQ